MNSNHFPARSVVAFLLSFLLSLFLGVICLIFIIQGSIMRPDFLKKQVEKSIFPQYRLEEIEDSFVSYGLASGFEEEFMQTVVSEEQVRTDILAQADALYADRIGSFDEERFADELYEKLLRNVRERGMTVDQETESAVYHLAEECAKIYAGHIAFPVEAQMAELLQALRLPLWIALAVSTLFVLTTAFLLYKLFRRKYKFLAHLVYALGGAFLLLGIPGMIILLSGRLQRLGITNQALYHLFQSYAADTVTALLIAAFALLLIAVVLFAAYRVGRRRFIESLHE